MCKFSIVEGQSCRTGKFGRVLGMLERHLHLSGDAPLSRRDRVCTNRLVASVQRCRRDRCTLMLVENHRDLLRGDWIHAVMTQVQIAVEASVSSETNASQIVARLASRIPAPVAPLEQLVAIELLQRTGWEVLRRQV